MASSKTIAWGDGSNENITLTANNWSGNETVTLSTPENFGAQRACTIIFYSTKNTSVTASLACTQSAATSSLSLTSLSWGSQDVSAKTFQITTNISTADRILVSVNDSNKWTATKSAFSSGKVTITVIPKSKNTSTSAVSGSVTVKVGRLSNQTVSLTQSANAVVKTEYLNPTTTILYTNSGTNITAAANNGQGTISGVCTRTKKVTYQDGSTNSTTENYSPTLFVSAGSTGASNMGMGETKASYLSVGNWLVTYKHPSAQGDYITSGSKTLSITVRGGDGAADLTKQKDFTVTHQGNVPVWSDLIMESSYLEGLESTMHCLSEVSIFCTGTPVWTSGYAQARRMCPIKFNKPSASWITSWTCNSSTLDAQTAEAANISLCIAENTGGERTAITTGIIQYGTASQTLTLTVSQSEQQVEELYVSLDNNMSPESIVPSNVIACRIKESSTSNIVAMFNAPSKELRKEESIQDTYDGTEIATRDDCTGYTVEMKSLYGTQVVAVVIGVLKGKRYILNMNKWTEVGVVLGNDLVYGGIQITFVD